MAEEKVGIQEVTDAEFPKKIEQAEGVAALIFWAPWCGPCRQMMPLLKDLANGDYAEKVLFYKMNVDENQKIPNKFGIRGIPTLIVFKDGKFFQQIIGAMPEGRVTAMLDAALAK